MKLRVLALDYDGTIAEGGQLHPEARAVLGEARAQGLVVVLVTGRVLDDLRCLVGDLSIFDVVVAENGALAAFPAAGRSAMYAPRVPEAFLAALREEGIEHRAGTCLVDLDAESGQSVLAIVRRLGLPLVLHFNRSRLMVLPQATSKATGLREALRTMRLSPHNAVAVGDAENDHELLAACELGAAVAWGSPALCAGADLVVPGSGPRDTAAFLRRVARRERIEAGVRPRRRLVLGCDDAGEVVSLAVRGRNVLIAGDPRSGKSWVGGLLCEQLVLERYCVCVLDPEGDYAALESLPGVVLMGADGRLPSMHELARALRHADVSVVLDLVRLSPAEKREYVIGALRMLGELRRETGLPHRIVVDEAHYFLERPDHAALLDAELAGYTLITYRVGGLHPDVLAAAECVVVTREGDPEEARLLHSTLGGEGSAEEWVELLGELAIDEAVLLPPAEESAGRPRRFRIAPRLTKHVRHEHKYRDLPVAEHHAFHFRWPGGAAGPVVRTLDQLVGVLECTPYRQLEPHVARGDLSRWIADVYRDTDLAGEARELEELARLGSLPDFNGALVRAVRERYGRSSKAMP